MRGFRAVNQLLACAVLLCIALSGSLCQPVSTDEACPPKYPRAQLVQSCPPVPAWCARVREGHGSGRAWPQCGRGGCRTHLEFGRRKYGVRWASQKAKVPLFGLDLTGWRRRSLTIWRGRIYARRRVCPPRRACRQGRWQVVYQVDGQLVLVDANAAPPYKCGAKAAKAAKGRRRDRRLRGLKSSCHGNKCTLRLSLHRLLQQAKHLLRRRRHRRHRHRRHGRHRRLILRFVLAASRSSGRVRFVSGELLPATASHGGGRQGRRDQQGSSGTAAGAYRRFLDRRRQNYWRKEGWRSGGGRNGTTRRRGGRGARGGSKRQHAKRKAGGGRRKNSRNHQKSHHGDGGQFKQLDKFLEAEGGGNRGRMTDLFNL